MPMSRFQSDEIKGRSVLILGFGREGRSVHKFLSRNYPEITISLADEKKIDSHEFPVRKTFFGVDYLDHLNDFDTVVRSPGIPTNNVKLKDYLKKSGWVTTLTNIFLSLFCDQVIGITGSKGKSTTSALIFEIFKDHFKEVELVGNIGKPALDIFDTITPNTKIVMELSSHQLEDVRYSPQTAVILRLFPEHLDHFADYAAYTKSKLNISKYQDADDFLIINENDRELVRLSSSSQAQKHYFSLTKTPVSSAWAENEQIWMKKTVEIEAVLMQTRDMGLKGKGNLENVLAAVTVACLYYVPKDKIKRAITKFTGLPHRLEFIGKFIRIEFYNDSLSTVPEATIHACETLGEKVQTLILGGLDRKLDQQPLVNFLLAKRHIKNLILFPDTGDIIGSLIENKNTTLKLFYVSAMSEAVKIAFSETQPDKICLLSPAAASFNLFKDYKDRGDQFKKYVSRHGQI